MQKKFIILLVSVLVLELAAAGRYLLKGFSYGKEAVPAAVSFRNVAAENMVEAAKMEKNGSPEVGLSLPTALNLQMTFYAQAPFGNWDYPWQEACEEASTLLVANTYFGYGWSADKFNDQILRMVEWENQKFGDYKHTTVAQTAQIFNEYLGLKTVIHENPTFEDVKNILNKGHLIVMTFAGKLLGNPNFRNGGPNYHAMVIKGYKADSKIITEDVGTRNGENYVYSWGVIANSLHDYAVPIESGGKRLIEVIPPTAEDPSTK